MKRILALTALSLGIASSAIAQSNPYNLRTGKLPNGLTYYICPTEYTPGEVHLYLLQNVGGILEADNQQGMAHFLEHIAFNPTKNFPKGVMNYLLQSGLNTFDAKTGINETRYQINSIPTNDKGKVDSTMLVLKDWVDGVQITPEAVNKERAIVLEEWRQRAGVNRRITDAIAPYIYNNSAYSFRNTIGSEEGLKSYSAKDIQAFYNEWYKPELQSVMIIGDIKPEEYEAKLIKLFTAKGKSKKQLTRTDVQIPDNKEPLYYRFIDAANPSTSFGIYQRISVPPQGGSVNHTAKNLYQQIFNRVVARRISALRNEGKEEFIASTASYSPLVRAYDQVAWDVVPYPGKGLQALKQTLALREQLRREGITEEEFQGEVSKMIEDVKALLEEKDIAAPDNLMDLFKQNFLYNAPIRSLREEVSSTYEALAEMEREDVNAWIKTILDDNNLAFITFTSNADELNISLDEFKKLLSDVKSEPVLKLSSPKSIDKLIDKPIKAGTIKSEKIIKELDSKEWTLSNGAKLFYRYTPELKGEFYFAASREGGRSVVTPQDIPAYTAMQSLIMKGGLGAYNRNDLHAWLQDKQVDLNISLENYTDGFGGNAKSKDAKSFFEYLHAVLTQQNFTEEGLNKYKALQKYLYTTRMQTPRGQVDDSIKKTLYPVSEVNPDENLAYFDKIANKDIIRLFNEHLLSTGAYTYCIVGDIPELEAKKLVTEYLASLPQTTVSKGKTYNLDFTAPDENITREFTADLEGDVGEVEISFAKTDKLSDKEEIAVPVLETLLQMRLFDELREKEQGVYSIGVQVRYEQQPQASETISIHFNTQRENVDRMKAKAYDVLREIVEGKVSEQNFKQALIPHATQVEDIALTPKDNPMLWLVYLNSYAETGKVPNLSQKANAVHTEDLTLQDIVALAKKLTIGAKKRDIVVKSLPREAGQLHH